VNNTLQIGNIDHPEITPTSNRLSVLQNHDAATVQASAALPLAHTQHNFSTASIKLLPTGIRPETDPLPTKRSSQAQSSLVFP